METFTNTITRTGGDLAATKMSGISETPLGPPPQYGGSPDTLNPEEMLVASVNGCLLLVLDHFTHKAGITVASYQADAKGTVEKTKNGLRFTRITVNAQVAAADGTTAEKLNQAAKLAEKSCLVSGSLNCPVEYNINVTEPPKE